MLQCVVLDDTKIGQTQLGPHVKPAPPRSRRKRKHVPHYQRPTEFVYRRNNRERRRVHNVNSAFEILRQHVPIICHDDKTPKINILRHASHYIQSLLDVLQVPDRNVFSPLVHVATDTYSTNGCMHNGVKMDDDTPSNGVTYFGEISRSCRWASGELPQSDRTVDCALSSDASDLSIGEQISGAWWSRPYEHLESEQCGRQGGYEVNMDCVGFGYPESSGAYSYCIETNTSIHTDVSSTSYGTNSSVDFTNREVLLHDRLKSHEKCMIAPPTYHREIGLLPASLYQPDARLSASSSDVKTTVGMSGSWAPLEKTDYLYQKTYCFTGKGTDHPTQKQSSHRGTREVVGE